MSGLRLGNLVSGIRKIWHSFQLQWRNRKWSNASNRAEEFSLQFKCRLSIEHWARFSRQFFVSPAQKCERCCRCNCTALPVCMGWRMMGSWSPRNGHLT